jgi:hypothetical protein
LKKFYLAAAILFFTGLAILFYGAEMSAQTPISSKASAAARVSPPIFIYTGGLIMLCGALAFVSAFSTHTRIAANLPPKYLIEL